MELIVFWDLTNWLQIVGEDWKYFEFLAEFNGEKTWEMMLPVFNRNKFIVLNDSNLIINLNVPICSQKKLTYAVYSR